MADITYPVYFPFAGTDTLDGDQIGALFYDASAPTASLSVANGFLSEPNFASDFLLENVHTQRGSAVDAWSAAGTANLDFKQQLFGQREVAAGEQYELTLADQDKTFAIPGAARTFYLPAESAVLVFWSLYVNCQIPDGTPWRQVAQLYLDIDGTPIPDSTRQLGGTYTVVASQVQNYSINAGFQRARVIHGHYTTTFRDPLDVGWHTAAIRLTTDYRVRFTRIHCCNLTVWRLRAPP